MAKAIKAKRTCTKDRCIVPLSRAYEHASTKPCAYWSHHRALLTKRRPKLSDLELFELTTGVIGHLTDLDQLRFVKRFVADRLDCLDSVATPSACTCKGHAHAGGVGGCYFGGTLVPRCPCKWRAD